ncbi:hypothetical protein [Arthrobacter cryoconiti]|uniref:Uncharacterized protein n=1 Tax=Arthrobacter cryoconiti TaxID=748907 RepID=A0ABV8QXI2_9MICC|nr:hypothetical protein [Arthrobacter cryoconiti]MCC9068819.1 hypothetical protein [Arthrobacter cryoconiti]
MSTVGTPRYQLAKEIFMADNADAPNPEREWDIALSKQIAYAYGIADGLIAAGYTRPPHHHHRGRIGRAGSGKCCD